MHVKKLGSTIMDKVDKAVEVSLDHKQDIKEIIDIWRSLPQEEKTAFNLAGAAFQLGYNIGINLVSKKN